MAVSQSHFRFGIDHLTESTHGWYAAEDVSPSPGALPFDKTFLLRFTLQCDATLLSNIDAEFQYRKNGGTWTQITTGTTNVKAVTPVAWLDAANTTQRLSGTGTFEASSQGCTADGIAGGTAFDIVASGNGEVECALQFVRADLVNGDVIDFRLTRDGGILIDTYAVNPSFTVSLPVFPRLPVTGPFPFPKEGRDYFPSISAAYAALSGLESILAVGTMAIAVTIALTGVSATGDVGTMVAGNDITIALTGVSSTLEQGSLTPDASSVLSGVESTVGQGSLSSGTWFVERPRVVTGPFPFPKSTPAFAVAAPPAALSGQGIATGIGSLTPSSTVELSGVSSTGAVGTVSPDRSVALSGSGISSSIGFLTVPGGAGLTGVSATPDVGTVTPDLSVGLVGNPTGFMLPPVGTLTPGADLPLTGVSATGDVGSVTFGEVSVALTGIALPTGLGILDPSTPGSAELSGLVSTGASGTVGPVISVALTGVSATGSKGTLTAIQFSIERPRALNGPFPFLTGGMFQFRQRARLVEPPSQSITIQLIGLSSSGSAGSMGVDRQAFPIGKVGTFSPGTLTPVMTLASSGVSGTSAVGSVTVSAAGSLSGQSLTASVGTTSPTLAIPTTGSGSTGAVGTFGLGQILDGETLFADEGTLSPVTTLALTGVSADALLNSLSASADADVTLGLTGVSATGAVGTAVPVFEVPQTSVVSTGSPGQLIPDVSTAVAGFTTTSAMGSAVPGISATPTGQSVTTSLGSVGLGQALVGQASTGSAGTTVANTSVSLTGLSATVAISSLGAQADQNVTVGLTGVSTTSAIGSVTPGFSLATTGVPLFTAIGSLGQSQGLTGVQATVSRGSVGAVVSIQLAGMPIVTAIQSLVAQTGGDATVGLTTVPIVTGLGLLAPVITPALTGNSVIATSAQGSVTVSASVALPALESTVSLGAVSASGSGQATLAGLQATVSLGSVVMVTGPTLNGFEVSGQTGQCSPDISIALVGVQTSVVLGTLHLDEPVVIELIGTSDTVIELIGTDG